MIEKLFEFVTDNFIFVFIIIGIISSLFGKEDKKKNNKTNRPTQEPQHRHQRPERTQTIKTIERKMEDMAKKLPQEAKKALDTVHPEKMKKVMSSAPSKVEEHHPNKYDQYARQIAEMEREVEHTVMNVTSLKKTGSLPHQQHHKTLKTFSKNNLVNGLIMHEILGPPRSKKKFR